MLYGGKTQRSTPKLALQRQRATNGNATTHQTQRNRQPLNGNERRNGEHRGPTISYVRRPCGNSCTEQHVCLLTQEADVRLRCDWCESSRMQHTGDTHDDTTSNASDTRPVTYPRRIIILVYVLYVRLQVVFLITYIHPLVLHYSLRKITNGEAVKRRSAAAERQGTTSAETRPRESR